MCGVVYIISSEWWSLCGMNCSSYENQYFCFQFNFCDGYHLYVVLTQMLHPLGLVYGSVLATNIFYMDS